MFENVIGHQKEKELLKSFLEKDNVSHAYLFSGKKGIGKSKIAREFARLILKTDSLESCPDFKYISKMEDKKDILVEQIRKELIDDIYISPIYGNKKVYIIDDADLLNTASQNSLLKTLEEPPKYVVIILVSSNTNSFLPTIQSRLNEIVFEGLNKEEVKEYAESHYNIRLSDNILDFIDGSIGNTINIIENNLLDKFSKIDRLYDKLASHDVISSFKTSEEIEFNSSYMLEYLEYILYKENKFSTIKFVENAKNRLKFNGNYDIIIDNMLLKIIDNI
ncbi:MAG: AAA family ATPase [Clostridia bacterium]|nr:AAA family ATPase [Clostridia bacterium]